MEPERVKAYLQAACAGLGFDIGEVWWTSNENGSSTVAAIEHHEYDEEDDDNQRNNGQIVSANGLPEAKKKLRFVQLYTSKSFESRRSELVNPPDSEMPGSMRRSNSTENLNKHVLSPRLVEAIARTTQVVWATTKKQEGLTGRSDIRLQTAVGMPVAVDANGNMCIVVMFSPNNIQSSDEAMDYLHSISQSATSSSIPCLLPVFDPNTSNMRHLPPSTTANLQQQQQLVQPVLNGLPEGVTARFVSLDDSSCTNAEGGPLSQSSADAPLKHVEHEVTAAPKDTFGIPMLPIVAELGHGNVTPEETIDVFDEASYGVWNTIMDSIMKEDVLDFFDSSKGELQLPPQPQSGSRDNGLQPVDDNLLLDGLVVKSDPALQVVLPTKSAMSGARKERLEEFCTAFLGMSVFDLADVWVPAGSDGYADCLRHVMSVSSTDKNERLNEFQVMSEHALIKFWTGAVGRAYSSGNPVWSANPSVFVDPARATVFDRAKIMTALAVPVFSNKEALPTCVVCCYSLVRSSSVPFVLRFVQQALRLLWEGLDNVEPHESVGKERWRDIAPADLGEMAADVEMQQHFYTKKRPHNTMTQNERMSFSLNADDYRKIFDGEDSAASLMSAQLQSIKLPDGETINVPLQLVDDVNDARVPSICFQTMQNHVSDAVLSVRNAVPFVDLHVSTNASGSKRAHVMGPPPSPTSGTLGKPLQMPRAFPTAVVTSSMTGKTGSSSNVNQPNASMNIAALSIAQKMASGDSDTTGSNRSAAYIVPVPIAPPSFIPNFEGLQFCQPTNVVDCYSDAGSDSSNKVCRIQGCDCPTVARRPYCEKHSGPRLCEHKGCNKCAQGSTRFCIAHGGGRRCTFPGCDKGARDKFFCAAHGGGKRCKYDGCSKSAVGGSSLCTAHGGGRRCAIDGCDKSAQSSTKFCVKHGGGKKCAHDGCEKVARGRTPFCAAHGGGVRCKLEGCNRVAIGKMQLCRAHGGSSSRSKTNGDRDSPDLMMDPYQPQGTSAEMARPYDLQSV